MRLTWRRPVDGVVCPRVKKGTDYHYIAGEFTQKVYDKLCEYEDAEEQGLLVRLPCKVGDTLYRPFFNSKSVLEYKIVRIVLRESVIQITACHYEYNMIKYEELVYIWQIGKKYFFTREEAEIALKGE